MVPISRLAQLVAKGITVRNHCHRIKLNAVITATATNVAGKLD